MVSSSSWQGRVRSGKPFTFIIIGFLINVSIAVILIVVTITATIIIVII